MERSYNFTESRGQGRLHWEDNIWRNTWRRCRNYESLSVCGYEEIEDEREEINNGRKSGRWEGGESRGVGKEGGLSKRERQFIFRDQRKWAKYELRVKGQLQLVDFYTKLRSY